MWTLFLKWVAVYSIFDVMDPYGGSRPTNVIYRLQEAAGAVSSPCRSVLAMPSQLSDVILAPVGHCFPRERHQSHRCALSALTYLCARAVPPPPSRTIAQSESHIWAPPPSDFFGQGPSEAFTSWPMQSQAVIATPLLPFCSLQQALGKLTYGGPGCDTTIRNGCRHSTLEGS